MSVSENNKLILTYRDNILLGLCFQDNRLVKAENITPDESYVGNIYIGRVKQVNKAINAAFVEFSKGCTCFLPLEEKGKKLLANREYDGTLKGEDQVVVQISRDASKNKECSATCNLSVSGKFFVLSSVNKLVGYSSKLTAEEKNLLKSVVCESSVYKNVISEFGLIFRSNSSQLTELEQTVWEQELDTLYNRLKEIHTVYKHRTLYSELLKNDISYLEFVRDCDVNTYSEIITDDTDIYKQLSEYMKMQPEYSMPLRLYEDKLLPLSKLYSVDTQLEKACSKKIYLNSGAYLYIEPTEALTVIDVNSGKKMYGKAADEYYLSVNMEAAKEIAVQLKLRNVSGIIIIDFINMKSQEHQQKLISHLKKCILTDRVKTTFVDITPLGLVELTRKKEKKTLSEQLYIKG